MYGTYANFEALEGTVSGERLLSLARKSRKIVITNDHATKDLKYKFNGSEAFGTLQGTESLSLYFITKTIIISGNDIPYRVWVYG